MKVHITTGEKTEGMLKKTKVYHIACRIELAPEEARVFPNCGTPIRELTPIYEYHDEAETRPKVIRLWKAVEDEDTLTVKSLGQLQQCENTILERCLDVQELLTHLQDFEVEKSYTVDLIEHLREDADE